MANRRLNTKRARVTPAPDALPPPRKKKAKESAVETPRAPRNVVLQESMAVLLGCVGMLTTLSLVSFEPLDASLNASGRRLVHNWIGPAGAYWSDLLLQGLGLGAYALALGLMLAAWRALTRRRIVPGLREGFGLALLTAAGGALSHLVASSMATEYPAGGLLGAILGTLLREQLAVLGSLVVAISMVLIALALTIDGFLMGIGVRSASMVAGLARSAQATFVYWKERSRARRELRATPTETPPPVPLVESAGWRMTTPVVDHEALEEARLERLEQAKAKAQEAAARAQARQEARAKRRAVRDPSEPEIQLSEAVDLPGEESFDASFVVPTVDGEPLMLVAQRDENDEDVPEPEVAIVAARPAPKVTLEAIEPAGLVPAVTALPRKTHLPASSEPQIVDARPTVDVGAMEKKVTREPQAKTQFLLPPPNLLDYEATQRAPIDSGRLRENAQKLTKTLQNYGIEGHVREIRTGPVVTMYEFVPAPGIKLSKIAGLADDLAMSMEAMRVRIVAPIPGKGAVGIEIPNDERETVYFKEIVVHDGFAKTKSKLTMALGKDIEGNPQVADLAKMPHLLVAGATGAGKSVSVNAMIMSILYNATPEDVRILMVDPKMLELSVYDGIPHLLLPVVTDPKKATLALRWAVEEMERRYKLMSEVGARNLVGYNKKVEDAGGRLPLPPEKEGGSERAAEKLPYIVVIVDELADLMMVASRDVESCIMRLAQMARAAGIHLILATQRPSVDVLTGVIKANFPTRIAFQVASRHDSRTIIDANGAENLLGKGDMLLMAGGASAVARVHGAYVSDEEIERVVKFLRDQGTPEYDESILAAREESNADSGAAESGEVDEMYDQALAIVTESRQASISMIQRRLRIGYNRAARLVEQMEQDGVVGPADGAKPREVLAPPPPSAA